jgi:hypothetical protein
MTGHTDKRRISAWVKDLREKQYIEWIYDPNDFIAKSQPAIYYLGSNGIRHFKQFDSYPTTELRKRYREQQRSQTFIDSSLAIADCCLGLEAARKEGTFPET